MINNEKKEKKLLTVLMHFFLYALCGALTALPLAIPSLWPIGWIAPCPVIYCELYLNRKKDSFLRAYGRGMSFFWFFGAVVFYWFWELYPLDFLGFDKASALITVILATCGIPLLQSLVSSLVFVAIYFLKKLGTLLSRPLLSSAFIAMLFVLSEFCHTLTWAGVPWGRFAVGQVGCLANVQSASLFGSYFITFIMGFFASLFAFSTGLIKEKNFKKASLCAAIATFTFLANFIFGTVVLSIPMPSPDSPEWVTVGAVQGNIRYEEKWIDKEGHTMDVYQDLSQKAAKEGCELILWPETAIPFNFRLNYRMLEYYRGLADITGSEIIVTSFETDDGDLYNTARLLCRDGTVDTTVYKKRHLVPFGEYIPMEELIETVFPPLAQMSATADSLSPGTSTEIIKTENGNVGVLICFDSIYEKLCIESVRDGAALIAVSTNDSWFSGSSALSQHNAQAQLRAIENGRYVLRAANTGISSVISPTGEIISSLGDGVQGYVSGDVRFITDTTLYTKTGNIFIAVSFMAVIGYMTAAFIESRKRDRSQ